MYLLYLFVIVKDIIVGKAQLRKQLQGDIMVLKHRTSLVALLIRASDTEEGTGVFETDSELFEDAAWGAMELDQHKVNAFESLLGIDRRTYRDYFAGRDSDTLSDAEVAEIKRDIKEQLGTEFEGDMVFLWAKKTMDLLNEAETRALFRTEDAFRAYFEARRLLLYGLVVLDKDAVTIRARSILQRAQNFSDKTRREAIEGLLTSEGSMKTSIGIQEVLEANEILHNHYLELYQRMESIRINILNFMVNTALAIVFIVFLFPGVVLNPSVENRTFLILVMIFGIMGASISGLLTAGRGSETTRYLEQVLGSWLAIARAIIGAASALLIYLLLVAGFVAPETLSASLILGVSFVAGFSERLLLQAIGTFENLGLRGK